MHDRVAPLRITLMTQATGGPLAPSPQTAFGLRFQRLFGLSPHTPFGLSLSKPPRRAMRGFDKLSPNGVWGALNIGWGKGWCVDQQPPFALNFKPSFGLSPHIPFGLSLSKPLRRAMRGFDKLSPNGVWGALNMGWGRGWCADQQPPFALSLKPPFGLSPHIPFGLSLSKPLRRAMRGFDKLSPNGVWGALNMGRERGWCVDQQPPFALSSKPPPGLRSKLPFALHRKLPIGLHPKPPFALSLSKRLRHGVWGFGPRASDSPRPPFASRDMR